MLLEMGRGVSAVDYVRGMGDLQRRSREVVAFFDDYDLLLTPTVGKPPPLVGALKDFDFSKIQEVFMLTPFTSMWNTTGQPASSVPVGLRRARPPRRRAARRPAVGRSDRDPGERAGSEATAPMGASSP